MCLLRPINCPQERLGPEPRPGCAALGTTLQGVPLWTPRLQDELLQVPEMQDMLLQVLRLNGVQVGLGILRSSTFLALYCGLAWRGACGGFQLTHSITSAQIPLSCWTGVLTDGGVECGGM